MGDVALIVQKSKPGRVKEHLQIEPPARVRVCRALAMCEHPQRGGRGGAGWWERSPRQGNVFSLTVENRLVLMKNRAALVSSALS